MVWSQPYASQEVRTICINYKASLGERLRARKVRKPLRNSRSGVVRTSGWSCSQGTEQPVSER